MVQEKAITDSGVCYASLKSESEISKIRDRLEGMSWMHQTIRWIEAIKDPTRFRMVCLLQKYDQLCVCDLANILEISSSAVSQHLRKLKDMNLVTARRVKLTIFYRLTDVGFKSFFESMTTEVRSDERIEVSV